MKLITIIKNDKFTGTQYSKGQFSEDVANFHRSQGENWILKEPFDLISQSEGLGGLKPENENSLDLNLPQPTENELQEASDIQKSIKRDEAQLKGKPKTINGIEYQISFTERDGNGMVQVKNSFDLGSTKTTIHFENGTNLPITSDEFLEFGTWFISERNKFFNGEWENEY
jgi:hypothetical protein